MSTSTRFCGLRGLRVLLKGPCSESRELRESCSLPRRGAFSSFHNPRGSFLSPCFHPHSKYSHPHYSPSLESIWGFPDSSVGKESTCSVGDLGSILRLGRSPREGKGYPLQCSGLENSMDYTGEFHGVAKSRTLLSDFHSLPWRTFNFMTCRVFIVSVSVHSKCSGESSFLLFNHLRN